jgi:hypothetical protein
MQFQIDEKIVTTLFFLYSKRYTNLSETELKQKFSTEIQTRVLETAKTYILNKIKDESVKGMFSKEEADKIEDLNSFVMNKATNILQNPSQEDLKNIFDTTYKKFYKSLEKFENNEITITKIREVYPSEEKGEFKDWITSGKIEKVNVYIGKSPINKVFTVEYFDVLKNIFLQICSNNKINKEDCFLTITSRLNNLVVVCFAKEGDSEKHMLTSLKNYNLKKSSIPEVLDFMYPFQNFYY